MRADIAEILYTEEQLAEIVKNIGRRISEDYKDKNLFMVSVLKGSLIFMADLMRAVDIPCSIDFLSVSSYGSGTSTSGAVRILNMGNLPFTQDLKDFHAAKIAERAAFEKRKASFQMVIDDVYSIGKGRLVGRPRY